MSSVVFLSDINQLDIVSYKSVYTFHFIIITATLKLRLRQLSFGLLSYKDNTITCLHFLGFLVIYYTLFVVGILFSHCQCVRPSVHNVLFFNNLKSHCWIFIKPCKHVHICKTNTLDKKIKARGQFY